MSDDEDDPFEFTGIGKDNAGDLWEHIPKLAKLFNEDRPEFEKLVDRLRSEGVPAGRLDKLRRDVSARVKEVVKAARVKRARGKDGETFIIDPDSGKVLAKASNIRLAISKLGYQLRMNDFDDMVYISQNGGPEQPVDNELLEDLWVALDDEFDFEPRKDKFGTVLSQTARTNRFHPVRDYLHSLKWDGKKRLDTWLHDYLGVEQNVFTREAGRLFIKGLVQRAMEPGSKFDEMLLLCGDQGQAKSTAMATLMPNPDWFTDSLPLHESDQKIIELTGGKWLAEISDLKGNTKAETDSVKAMLSRRADKARMAYARLPMEKKRQFAISGTSNKETPLSDPSGNRRYWPVVVVKIDIAGLAQARDQLFAEAMAEYKPGVDVRLDPKYYDVFREVQASFQKENALETELRTLLEQVGDGVVRASDLWQSLRIPVERRGFKSDEFGAALKAMGFKRGMKRWNRGKDAIPVYKRGTSERRIVLHYDDFEKVLAFVYAGEGIEASEDVETEVEL